MPGIDTLPARAYFERAPFHEERGTEETAYEERQTIKRLSSPEGWTFPDGHVSGRTLDPWHVFHVGAMCEARAIACERERDATERWCAGYGDWETSHAT